MPIYEYACNECGHQLEALQKISDAPLVSCPECGAEALTKQISKVAFRLKGTGWYETDFKDKKKKDDGGKTDAKSETKTDTKSETKSKSDSGSSSSPAGTKASTSSD
ncbi:MAG: zinc ribbon domain-containing protein [Pseudomonadota bacterium]